MSEIKSSPTTNQFEELLNKATQKVINMTHIWTSGPSKSKCQPLPKKRVTLVSEDEFSEDEKFQPVQRQSEKIRTRVMTYEEAIIRKRKLDQYRRDLKREQEEDRQYRRLGGDKENWTAEDEDDLIEDSLADFVVDNHSIDKLHLKDTSQSSIKYRSFLDDECEEGEEEIDDSVADDEQELYNRMKGIKDYYENEEDDNDSEDVSDEEGDEEDDLEEENFDVRAYRRSAAQAFVLDEAEDDEDHSGDEIVDDLDGYESDFIDDQSTLDMSKETSFDSKKAKKNYFFEDSDTDEQSQSNKLIPIYPIRKRKVIEDSDDEQPILSNREMDKNVFKEIGSVVVTKKKRTAKVLLSDDEELFPKEEACAKKELLAKPETIEVNEIPVFVLDGTLLIESNLSQITMEDCSLDNLTDGQLFQNMLEGDPSKNEQVSNLPHEDLDWSKKKPVISDIHSAFEQSELRLSPIQSTPTKKIEIGSQVSMMETKEPTESKQNASCICPDVLLEMSCASKSIDPDIEDYEVILDASNDSITCQEMSFTQSELNCSRLSERMRKKMSRKTSFLFNRIVYYSN